MNAVSPAAAPRPVLTGMILACVGAIGFSGKAIIVKLSYRYGVDAITVITYRMLFALPLFLLLSWWSGRGTPALTMANWRLLLGLGVSGYYLASLLDFAGLQYVSANLERLILYLNPTIVLALGLVLFQRKVTRKQVIALSISYLGVMVVFGHDMKIGGEHTLLGALLVFGSAVSYSMYLVYSGEAVKAIGTMRLCGVATSIACVLCIVQFLVLRPVSELAVEPGVVWLAMLNATLCTFVPIICTMMAIERVGAGMTSQIGMTGPVSTIILSMALLDEPITLWMLSGTVLVMTGIWMVTRPAK